MLSNSIPFSACSTFWLTHSVPICLHMVGMPTLVFSKSTGYVLLIKYFSALCAGTHASEKEVALSSVQTF